MWQNVAIITPYNQQKVEIKKLLVAEMGPAAEIVDVDTVDSFQGQERDVLIISCVRSERDIGTCDVIMIVIIVTS